LICGSVRCVYETGPALGHERAVGVPLGVQVDAQAGVGERAFDQLPGRHAEARMLRPQAPGQLADHIMVLARLGERLDHLARDLQHRMARGIAPH